MTRPVVVKDFLHRYSRQIPAIQPVIASLSAQPRTHPVNGAAAGSFRRTVDRAARRTDRRPGISFAALAPAMFGSPAAQRDPSFDALRKLLGTEPVLNDLAVGDAVDGDPVVALAAGGYVPANGDPVALGDHILEREL